MVDTNARKQELDRQLTGNSSPHGQHPDGSARAALIYQRATKQRGAAIADALSVSIDLEHDRARNGHGPAD